MSPQAASRKRICIVGAGVSGLVAAKIFLRTNRDVVVIEKAAEIAGVWAPSKSYPGVRTQSPRDIYSFSDFPMSKDYPEWPTGAQIYAYLCDYAQHFGVQPHIRLNTEIRALARSQTGGWQVTLQAADGERLEHFDEVAICTGQFCRPRTLDLPGAEAFRDHGGMLVHSSQYLDDAAAVGRDVVVLGYSKSATDIAMQTLAAGARSVTLVHRELAWKIPYFFGNLVNFKNILYCRATEVMFMPWSPSRFGRIARRIAAPAIWANWRALEALLTLQFGLKKRGLRPAQPIEDSIHCATSIETPGFYQAVARGKIKMVRGTLAACAPGSVTTDQGSVLPAQLVVLAIGWSQDLPFLEENARRKLIEPDGLYRLYRLIANPDLPGLGFVGFNSSFATPLSAELGAHWLARWFDAKLVRNVSEATMGSDIARALQWRRKLRPVAAGFGGLCIAPYHFFHFDELLRDMGAKTRPANPLAAYFLPLNPADYANLLATAPAEKEIVA